MSEGAALEGLLPDEAATVEALGPGVETLSTLRRAYLAGELGAARNRLAGTIEPLQESELEDVRETTHVDAEALALGRRALERGRVGLVVLNGGMATRFGGVVKGVLPVDDQRSFLGLKLLDALRVAQHYDAEPPIVILMNSRATSGPTRAHLDANDYFGYPEERVWLFEQQWAVRLRPSGEVYRDNAGAVSFYGPGHGDLVECIVRAGLLEQFIEGGGQTLLMSNVDNVPATLDLELLGRHLRADTDLSVELVDKRPGDTGGAPARVDGRAQIVESFRLPEGFDTTRLPVFNTNTLWIRAQALQNTVPLTWFAVEKRVDDQAIVQFERLVGELSAHVGTHWLRVPREGRRTRFVPVKHPDDLGQQRAELLDAWTAHGPA
ncbi:MAG: UTP--glucose-1-phosphate uridylyltransferase [Bradymonadia bacterium]|jgi:UTP--glucose-1-phosphate uridylyltransferase